MSERIPSGGILAEVYAILLRAAERAESPQETQTPCGEQGASRRGIDDGPIIADLSEA